ncbi:hypothetical protein NX059_008951 [Plenodomus lindquistii]|nr:hypothetical protein NX059_008951 [Plenodomus lindquistii]
MSTAECTAKQRPPPREIYASPIVTVKVGPKAKEYSVHEALATHYSAYFHRAIGSDFIEGQTGVVMLADIEEATFEVFSDWLYTQSLPEAYKRNGNQDVNNATREYQRGVILLCIFADRFIVPALKAPLKHLLLHSLTDHGPYFDGLRLAAEGLSTDHPVVRMLVDAHCIRWSPDSKTPATDDEKLEDLPVEFLCGLARRYAQISKSVVHASLRIDQYLEPGEVAEPDTRKSAVMPESGEKAMGAGRHGAASRRRRTRFVPMLGRQISLSDDETSDDS